MISEVEAFIIKAFAGSTDPAFFHGHKFVQHFTVPAQDPVEVTHEPRIRPVLVVMSGAALIIAEFFVDTALEFGAAVVAIFCVHKL
jgi:hypothetical protein